MNDVNHPHVQMIIDYYHMRVENEDPEILRTAREHIVHLHFADPQGLAYEQVRTHFSQIGGLESVS